MTLKQKSATVLTVLLSSLAMFSTADAAWKFRGVDRLQFNSEGTSNKVFAEPLNRQDKDYYVDIEDKFERIGDLSGSYVDTHRSQLIPSTMDHAPGLLSGAALARHGLWSADGYSTSNGRLVGNSATPGLASIAWAVAPGVGDDYLLEMSAVIAEGGTARFGYLGEQNSSRSINSDLAELGMSITRLSGTQLEWSVSWNMDDGTRQDFSSTLQTQTDTTGEEVRLQLGWEDIAASNNDLFDAWIETSEGASRLLAGNMATSIDVEAVGLELEGEGVFVTNFRAAVPEPTSLGLAFIALIGLLSTRRRVR